MRPHAEGSCSFGQSSRGDRSLALIPHPKSYSEAVEDERAEEGVSLLKLAEEEEPQGIQMTIYIRMTEDGRFGLKKNGEFHLIGQKMIGILPDTQDFEEAVEREKIRLQSLLPREPEQKEEEIL